MMCNSKRNVMKTNNDKLEGDVLVLAIFRMPFMHRLTQSMADNTYVRARGKNIIKTKIDVNTSNTPPQAVQRLKMKCTVELCKALNGVIHAGFPERPRTSPRGTPSPTPTWRKSP